MSLNNFTPDTALALLNSTSADTARAAEKLKDTAQQRKLQQIEGAAQDFEAVFLAEMMKPMFETVETNAMFGGGKGEEVFKSLLIQEYGKILAATGQIGIAEHVKLALIEAQAGGSVQNGTDFANTVNKFMTTPNIEEAP